MKSRTFGPARVEVAERSIRQPGVKSRLAEISEVGLIDQAPDLEGQGMARVRERLPGPSRTAPRWNSHRHNILNHVAEFHKII